MSVKALLLGGISKSQKVAANNASVPEPEKKIYFIHEFEVSLKSFEDCKFDICIPGPQFVCCHKCLGLEWQASIFPKGRKFKDGQEVQNMIGIVLEYHDGPWMKINASLQSYFILPDCRTPFPKSTKRAHGTYELNEIKGIMFHTNDVAQLRAEGLISARETIKFGLTLQIPEKYFDWELCHKELVETKEKSVQIEAAAQGNNFDRKECFFGPLFTGPSTRDSVPPDGSDFLVTFGESDTVFHSHRLVLQQKIPEFFNKMISSGMEEAESGSVDFHAFQPESLSHVLYFIYNNHVSDDFYTAESELFDEILHLSEMLQLPKLKLECGKHLLAELNPGGIFFNCNTVSENVEKITDTADKYQMNEVMGKCMFLKAKHLCVDNAVDLLIRSNKLDLEPIRNLAFNFVAENLQKLWEQLDDHSSVARFEKQILILCQKRMLAQKQLTVDAV